VNDTSSFEQFEQLRRDTDVPRVATKPRSHADTVPRADVVPRADIPVKSVEDIEQRFGTTFEIDRARTPPKLATNIPPAQTPTPTNTSPAQARTTMNTSPAQALATQSSIQAQAQPSRGQKNEPGSTWKTEALIAKENGEPEGAATAILTRQKNSSEDASHEPKDQPEEKMIDLSSHHFMLEVLEDCPDHKQGSIVCLAKTTFPEMKWRYYSPPRPPDLKQGSIVCLAKSIERESNEQLHSNTRIFKSCIVREIEGKNTEAPYEKSRLVVQGYGDKEKHEYLTKSPTIQRCSQRLLLALTPSLHKAGHTDADEHTLREIKKFCHQCQTHDSAPRRFKFTLKDDREFNYEIVVDVMYLEGKPVLHVVKLGTTDEKRLMVDILSLRQSYERREITEIRWISGNDNPADALTKASPNRALESFLDNNTLSIRVEGSVQRPAGLGKA